MSNHEIEKIVTDYPRTSRIADYLFRKNTPEAAEYCVAKRHISGKVKIRSASYFT